MSGEPDLRIIPSRRPFATSRRTSPAVWRPLPARNGGLRPRDPPRQCRL